MAKRFCSECLTFHEGACSAAALARNGKGGKKSKGRKVDKPVEPVEESATTESVPVDQPEEHRPSKPNVARSSRAGATTPKQILLEQLQASLAKIEAEKAAQREATRIRVAKHRAEKKAL